MIKSFGYLSLNIEKMSANKMLAGNLKKNDHLKVLGVDGRIILKLILKS
jgi:hypothetical protein